MLKSSKTVIGISPRGKYAFVLFLLIAILLCSGLSVSTYKANAATQVVVSSTAHTETTISLSWTESNDWIFTSYDLYISYSSWQGPWYHIWSTGTKGETTTYVSGLNPNTSYWFYIMDTGFAVGSTNSNPIEVTTVSNPSLQLTSQTATTASFLWNDYNSYSSLVPFDSYTVQMSTSGPSGPWSTLNTITDRLQNTYTITGLSPGLYYVRMYDTVGLSGDKQVSYSNVITVSIITVTITTNSPTLIGVYQTAQFTASANGGSSSFNYQWYSSDSPIAGATSSTFVFSSSVIGTYDIKAMVQDSFNPTAPSATSNTITVSVIRIPVNVTITSNSGAKINVGQTAQFTASASGGSSSFSYQWYSNGSPIEGATSSTFAFSSSNAGEYSIYVVAQDSLDSSNQAISNTITVTVVNPVAVSITTTSANTISVGQSAQFSASASGGSSSFNYQWYSNGSSVSGATSSSFTFSPTAAGTYNINVIAQDSSNPSNQATSNTLTVIVHSQGIDWTYYVVAVVIVIIIVIGVVAYLVFRRRNRNKPQN